MNSPITKLMFLQVDETGHRSEGVGVSRDLGRTKMPINPANGGIAIIPPRLSAGQAYCSVLLCTPHSSEFLRVKGNAQSHPFGVGPSFWRLVAGRAARLRRAFDKASIRMPYADLYKGLQRGRLDLFDQPVKKSFSASY